MKTKAVRLYGKNDLRLEEFELPQISDDEVLARVVSDSICMSSYKAAMQGEDHKRVPKDILKNPVIIGHEFCGDIVEVGKNLQGKISVGQKFSIQPALNYKGRLDAPGYSFQHIGGLSTYIIIPKVVFDQNCFLPFDGDAFFYGSLAEPMSCIVGAFKANYHTKAGSYKHKMGIIKGGRMCILAGAGPMGLGAIDYAIHCDRKPALLVVTDIDEVRLSRAQQVLSIEEARKNGVELVYVNTMCDDPVAMLMALTKGEGYDDVFAFAPVKSVVEQGDAILGKDGCLNFFAGPTNSQFKAEMNFYNVHYASTHIVGTSGGNTDDMIESLSMMQQGKINPSMMVTHIGGMDAAIDSTLNLSKIPGGKKLIYVGIDMPLTEISKFSESGDPVLAALDKIVKKHNGLWNAEAEKYLLANKK